MLWKPDNEPKKERPSKKVYKEVGNDHKNTQKQLPQQLTFKILDHFHVAIYMKRHLKIKIKFKINVNNK